MKRTKKNLLMISGIIGVVIGAALLFPSFSERIYWLASLSVVLMIVGLILLAIAFGD